MIASPENPTEPPRLASYRKAAKALKRAVRDGEPEALARIAVTGKPDKLGGW